jgi:Domain of unknown function (DUF4091)
VGSHAPLCTTERPVRTRRLRRTLAAAVLGTAALAAGLAAAPVAQAAVWTIGAGDKAFPSSPAGNTSQISLFSAGNEYQAAQVVVKGAGPRTISLSWGSGTAPLLSGNSALSQVGYVKVTTPSSFAKSKAGTYPDPLLPTQFGRAVRVPAYATAFYVLIHVPANTPAGDYSGTLQVSEDGQITAVPVTLHVWAFSLPADRVATVFPISLGHVRDSLKGAIRWTYQNQKKVFDAYYTMFAQHGIAPAMLNPIPSYIPSTGHAKFDYAGPLLSAYFNPGPNVPSFSTTRVPLDTHWPIERPSMPGSSKVQTYLTDMFNFYKATGWQDKTYTWVYDEPSPGSQERLASAVAKMVHRASAAAGYRARVLITDEPRPKIINRRPPNTFLFGDIDIWVPRIFRFWDNLPAINAQLAAGKQVWMYTYAWNPHTAQAPTFLIDESTSEEHAIFWMMYKWNATGLLYWQTNRWINAGGGAYRDPYQHPLSFRGKVLKFNGEGSLIYPGYEPQLGLNDPFAPPVSSLRFEALRDGTQEYAYLQLAGSSSIPSVARAALTGLARSMADQAAFFPAGYKHKRQYNLPSYQKGSSFYANARIRLGMQIELALQDKPLTVVAGRVVSASTGKPLTGVRISDGLLAVTTAADGSFRMVGALPGGTLTVQKAGYVSHTERNATGESLLLRLDK